MEIGHFPAAILSINPELNGRNICVCGVNCLDYCTLDFEMAIAILAMLE